MNFSSTLFLLLLFCMCLVSLTLPSARDTEDHPRRLHRVHRRPYNGTRHHRQIPSYPERNEKSAAYCGKHEHHVICGPEKHCDKSCDNLYSPPHCYHDSLNPKCYSPRCLCNEGFVRNAVGHCIRPTRCPHRYSEPKSELPDDDMVISFKPMRFRHHKIRRVRHRKPTYFW